MRVESKTWEKQGSTWPQQASVPIVYAKVRMSGMKQFSYSLDQN